MSTTAHHVFAVSGRVVDGKVIWAIEEDADLPGNVFDSGTGEWRATAGDDEVEDEGRVSEDLRKRLEIR